MATPQTQFAGGPESYVAYQTVGNGPVDLVFVDHWMTNIDVMWESPRFTSLYDRLSSFSRLVLYDKRGTGLSDPPSDSRLVATVEDAVEDLAVVLDAVGSTQCAIVTNTIGGLVAVQFAAAFPERVTSLVLSDFTPRLARDDTWPWGFSPRMLNSVVEMMRNGYGIDGALSHGRFAPSLIHDEAFNRWSARYARLSCSPGKMAKYWESAHEIDVRAVLPLIQAPTLLMAHMADPIYPLEMYEWIEDAIPNARLVQIDAPDHFFWAPQPEWVFDEVERFVTGHEPESKMFDVDRVLAAVVFTDIVGSTRELAEVGDKRFKAVLDVHDRTTLSCAERFRGNVVRTTGDGALLTFDGPARALRFVLALRQELEMQGIDIRAGVHAGEIEVRGNDLTGLAVHIGARVMEACPPGQVVCSRTVKDLVAGAGLMFEDLGTRTLKGVPDDWQLFAVSAA